MNTGHWRAVGIVLLLAGCGGESGNAEVGGNWVGGGSGESTYLELQQSGSAVTGQACERPGHDCYPIKDGKLSGQSLTFCYEFDTHKVTATLTLSVDGKTLTGSYHSTKCNCDLAVSLTKQ